ncbi:MAG: glycosyltransferase family 2 protein [Erythrobacter sp.]
MNNTNRFDVVASCVLFKTPLAEVERLCTQLAQSNLRLHLVLVDNSPVPLKLAPFDPQRVTILRPGKNVGYGRANNIAMKATKGWSRYFLILNSDLTFHGTGLDRMVAYMDAQPDVALTAPRVCYPDGRTQTLCRLLPTPLDLFGRQFRPSSQATERRDRKYEFRDWSYDHPAQFPFLSGCFLLARRKCIEEVEGFDERFFLYGEDLDLSRRLHGIGRTMFVPAFTIAHDYRSQSSKSLRLTILKLQNLARYFTKWGWLQDAERDAVNAEVVAGLGRHKDEPY